MADSTMAESWASLSWTAAVARASARRMRRAETNTITPTSARAADTAMLAISISLMARASGAFDQGQCAAAAVQAIVRGTMSYPSSELVIDPVLIRKYDVSGPRYTSYPTADRFVEAFGEAEFRRWLEKRNIGGFSQPLSVYVHLPFCDTACYYCACNKVVTGDHSKSAKYINYTRQGT